MMSQVSLTGSIVNILNFAVMDSGRQRHQTTGAKKAFAQNSGTVGYICSGPRIRPVGLRGYADHHHDLHGN